MRFLLFSIILVSVYVSACNAKIVEEDFSDDADKPEKRERNEQPDQKKDDSDRKIDDLILSPDDKAVDIYDDDKLHTFELLLDQADLDKINANPAAEEYVEGALVFKDETYAPVGIRYKGSVGGFWGCTAGPAFQIPATGEKTCPKLSMKVKFNWLTNPEGRFYGLKKLQFHSMIKDPSLMRERLGYALFNQMNVPAPRVVHAKLFINGRFEGLFALVEQIDGRFTRSRFSEGGEGNLYKEIWPIHDDPAAYLNALETNTEEDPSVDKILDFKSTIESQDADDAIWNWLDRDHQMRYIAVDRTIVNDDGIFHWYCNQRGQGRNPGGLGNHNYYWYEAAEADRLWLIPWDLDLAFRGNSTIVPIQFEWNDPNSSTNCGCGGVNLVRLQQPPYCDRLTQLWASEDEQYESAVAELLKGPFSDANVTENIQRWAAQIDDAVKEQAATTHNGRHISYSEWQEGLRLLLETIEDLRSEARARIQ